MGGRYLSSVVLLESHDWVCRERGRSESRIAGAVLQRVTHNIAQHTGVELILGDVVKLLWVGASYQKLSPPLHTPGSQLQFGINPSNINLKIVSRYYWFSPLELLLQPITNSICNETSHVQRPCQTLAVPFPSGDPPPGKYNLYLGLHYHSPTTRVW